MPCDGGDKVVSTGLLKSLAKLSELHLFNIADELGFSNSVEKMLRDDCKSISIYEDPFISQPKALLRSYFNHIPYHTARRKNVELRKVQLDEMIKKIQPDIIVWDHIRSGAYWVPNDAYNILLEHNDEVKIYKEKVARYPWFKRALLSIQVHLMDASERRMHSLMDRIVFLSAKDVNSAVVEKSCVMEYPITDFRLGEYLVKDNDQLSLLFLGSLDWYPNKEGLMWFIDNVLYELPENIKLIVVGKNHDPKFASYLRGMRKIELHENVPDTSIYFKQADVFISPVNSGSGINVKILEGAANCMPMVISGFSKRGYKNIEFIESANNPMEFKECIMRLVDNAARKKASEQVRNWFIEYQKDKELSIKKAFLN
jgi:hypothetical protein